MYEQAAHCGLQHLHLVWENPKQSGRGVYSDQQLIALFWVSIQGVLLF